MDALMNTFQWLWTQVTRRLSCVPCLLLCSMLVAGCGDKVAAPTRAELVTFDRIARKPLTVDMNAIRRAQVPVESYRVVSGDVLEFTMPLLLRAVTVAEMKDPQISSANEGVFVCRVSRRGTITLPAVGEVKVAGASLLDIEEQVVESYKDYVVVRPSVFVRVLEYQTYPVSITGAVAEPGIYTLRHDQMSLATLLMEAGGIVEKGAAAIHIGRAGGAESPSSQRQTVFGRSPRDQASLAYSAMPAVMSSMNNAPSGILGSSDAGGPMQVVFQKEGPTSTVGWLTVKRDSYVEVRTWLDLSSLRQRREFLDEVATRSGPRTRGELEVNLTQLLAHLQSASGDSAWLTQPIGGWQTIGSRQFECQLTQESRGDGPDLVSMDMDKGGFETLVEDQPPTLVLPVVGSNIPFRDVALRAGDTVVVEQIQEKLFSVLGLVNRPGNFPYPQNARYNIAQAIAFAGGLDSVADPRYVTVYRLADDGTIARVAFRLIEDNRLTGVLNTIIQPGDVVAVENTPRTRMNTTIHNMLRINMGMYVTGRDLWDNNN